MADPTGKTALATSLALALALPGPLRAVPAFTEQVEFGAGATICVAWGDPDGDGWLDLAVGNTFSQQNYCYYSNGDGTFTEVNRFGNKSTFALVYGDYDNDGDPDMAVGNQNFQNKLFVNTGTGFSGVNQFGAFSSIAMAWADSDLDGDLDMAVGNGILGAAQPNFLYVNNGDGTFTEQSQFGADQTGSMAWGDFDQDGDPDLAVGNGGFQNPHPNYLYVNNGDGTFTERPEFGMGDTSCLVWGDTDNDGDLDLAVANWNGGQNYLYVNNGDGTFTELPRFGMRDPNTMAWGDYDNDGDLDLAVGNGDFGSADQNYLYINEGGLVFTESAQFGLGSTDGVAWGDYDADGDLDLAAGNEHTPETNYLYVNGENDSDWLFLHLEGRFHAAGVGYSNRDGIGAKVTVYEAGFLGDPAHRLGFREIEAHGGFASQNAVDAHFGLPGRSSVDVRIEWPGSGGTHVTQDLTGVPVPGRAVIEEGVDPVSSPEDARPSESGAWLIVPNPTRGAAVLEYLRPTPARASLRVVDVTGRTVRTLAPAATTRGTRAEWNGRDESGHDVANGIYFVRIPGVREPGRVIVLR